MTKIPKDGLRPSPVYEVHMSDGEIVRLSFYSPAGKPIDMEAGRRAAEAIMLHEPMPIGASRAATQLEAYKFRQKVGGCYLDKPRLARVDLNPYPFVRGADGVMRRPLPRRTDLTIARAYVEHPTIGRVEHVPGMKAAPVKAKRKPRVDPAPLADRARAFALMLVDEFSRDKIDAQLVAQAVIGLREALKESPQ